MRICDIFAGGVANRPYPTIRVVSSPHASVVRKALKLLWRNRCERGPPKCIDLRLRASLRPCIALGRPSFLAHGGLQMSLWKEPTSIRSVRSLCAENKSVSQEQRWRQAQGAGRGHRGGAFLAATFALYPATWRSACRPPLGMARVPILKHTFEPQTVDPIIFAGQFAPKTPTMTRSSSRIVGCPQLGHLRSTDPCDDRLTLRDPATTRSSRDQTGPSTSCPPASLGMRRTMHQYCALDR